MARKPNQSNVVPQLIRIEPLESRVLYSADAAPLLAFVGASDEFTLQEQPPETELAKLIEESSDTRLLTSAASSDAGSITQVVIVDGTQSDIVELQTLLRAQLDDGERIAIVTLEATNDPIAAIADILSHYSDLEAMHIVSHASVGELQFGVHSIDQQSLLANSQLLLEWGASLDVDGDILLYGCNLSSTADGRLFAETLATLTDADVASSSDITGHALKNGDWDLEVEQGTVETPVIVQASIQNDWSGSLDITTGLIHHWKLDGDGVDSAGAANAILSDVGSVTGIVGQAGDFSGDSIGPAHQGEVSAGSFPGLGTSDFTASFWMQVNAADAGDRMFGNLQTNGTGFSASLDASGQVVFSIGDGATTQTVTGTQNITDGDWRYVVAKRSGTSLEMNIYNNVTGTWDIVTSSAGPSVISLGSISPLRMGLESTNSGNYDGLLDEIRIYNRAISFADAQELVGDTGAEEQVLAVNNSLSMSESGAPVTITSADLLTTDLDTPDTDLVYTIETLVGAAQIKLNGAPLSTGMSFTQADINNGLVSIEDSGAFPGSVSDSIALSVDDGQGDATFFTIDVFITPNVEQLVSSTSVTVNFAGAPLVITNSDLQAVDPDNTDDELVFVMYQQPSNVDLLLNGVALSLGGSFTQEDINNGVLSVVSTALPGPPAGEYVYFTVDDGIGTSTNSFIYVNIDTSAPVNTAPSAFHATFNINEDEVNPAGRSVSLLMDSGFADPDSGDYLLGVLVTSSPNTPIGGVWQYSTDGANWHAVGVTSETNALALSNSTLIRFLPDANYNGTPANLSVRVLDSTYSGPNFPVNFTDGAIRELASAVVNGGSTAISGSIDFITVNVLPVNDSPTLVNITMPSFDEDGAPILTTVQDVFGPAFSDPDTGDSLSAIAVVANPPTFEGEWAYSSDGTNWHYISGTNASNALVISATDYFRFLSAVNYNGSPPELVVHALDSTYTGATTIGNTRITINIGSFGVGDELSSLSAEASVVVIPVNDAPVIDTVASTVPGLLNEDTPVGTIVGTLVVADVENDPVTVVISGEGASYFSINAQYQIILSSSLNYESDNNISITFEATDPSAASDTWNTSIAVQDANESPQISAASLAGVFEDNINPPGATVSSLFASSFVDVDAGASLAGVAITGNTISTDGEWQYSTDGVSWTAIGPANVLNSVVLSQSDLVRFMPSANFNGTPASLSMRALDNGYTGSYSTTGSPFQIDTTSAGPYGPISVVPVALNTVVNAVNDRPVIGDEVLASIVEDDTNPPGESLLALFEFGMLDVDVGDSISGVVIVGDASNATQGHWEYSVPSEPWLPIGSVSPTQGLVLDRYTDVRFVPATDFTGSPGPLSVKGLDLSWPLSFTISSPVLVDITAPASDSASSVNVGLLETFVTPVNDAPTATSVTLSGQISEATAVGSVVGTVVVTDPENDPFTITPNSADANYFTINAADELVLTTPVDFETIQSLNIVFNLSDNQSASTNWSTTITVVDANEAPSISAASLAGVAEDTVNPAGATVASLFASTFADVDSGASLAGIAVTGNAINADGAWQHSSDGVTWYAIGPVSSTNALVVAQSDLLRFLPGVDFNGAVPSLTMHALDNDYAGGFTPAGTPLYIDVSGAAQFGAISISPVSLQTAVNPVNDRPMVFDATLPGVLEDTLNPLGDSFVNLFGSTFTDPDGGGTFTGVIVVGDVSNASQGMWEYSVDGTSWLPVDTVSATQGLVLDRYTLVRFVPAADFNGFPGSLSVYALDDSWVNSYSSNSTRIIADTSVVAADAALSSNIAVLNTVVNLVSDAPTAINAVAPLQVNENSAGGTAVGTVIGVDPDSSVLSYSLLNDAGGRFSIDSITGDITVANGAVLDFEVNSSHLISVQVTDSTALSFSQSLSVTVNDVNDPPVLTSAVSIASVNEDDVNSAGVRVGDVFPPVFTDPDTGQVLSGIAITQHDTASTTGDWEYRYSAGQWYSVGSVSQNSALVLGVNNWIRFVPAANVTGPASSLSVHGLDSSYNGGATVVPQYTQNLLDGSETAISTNSVAVTTTVLPVNDLPFGVQVNAQLQVNEDALTGDSLGFVSAQDIDDTTLTYSLSADAGGRFVINATTGEVSVSSTASLDYETDTFHQITVEVLDSSAQPVSANFPVFVNDVNEAPQLIVPSSLLVMEDDTNPAGENIGAVFNGGFSDVDGGDYLLAIAVVDNPVNVTGDWQFRIAGGSWQSVGAVSINNSLIISSAGELRFVPAADYFGAASPLTVYALDSAFTGTISSTSGPAYTNNLIADAGSSLSTASVLLNLLVAPVNDAPTVTLNSIIVSLSENTVNSSTVPGNTTTYASIDIADIVIDDVDGGTNILALSGADSTLFQITGNKLQLKPGVLLDYEAFSQLDVVVEVDDGNIGVNPDDSAQYTLQITDVNEAPGLGSIETTNLNFVENGLPVVISNTIVVAEPDNGIVQTANIQITAGYVPGEDLLAFVNQSGISGSYNVATGTLVLSGQATAAQYQSAIRSIEYSNTSANPSTGPRVIAVQVSDNALSSNTENRGVNIVAVNNAPTIQINPLVTSISENTPFPAPLGVADIVVTDVDGGPNTLSLSGTDASLFQIANDRLQLKPGITVDAETLTQLDVTVNVDDASIGSGIDDSASYALAIDDVNEPPILSAIESSTISFVENGSPVPLTSTIVIAEPDNGMINAASVQISAGFISGEDQLQFTDQNGITGSFNLITGVLDLTGQASSVLYQSAIRSIEYSNVAENPNSTVRVIQISVDDGVLTSNVASRAVSVTATNDAPTVQLSGIVASLAENTAITQAIDIADIVVSDVDGGVNTLSLSGAHASLFQITAGKLQLIPGVSLDAETLAQLNVTVNVDDASVGSSIDDSASYSLPIDNIDEPPVISAIETAVLTVQENDSPTAVSSTIVVAEPDNGLLDSAHIKFINGYVPAEDALEFIAQNGISGQYDQNTGVLILTGTGSAIDYQNAIRSVSYSNSSENPSTVSRVLEVSISDGVNSSNTLTRAVLMQAIEDAPVIQLSNLLNVLPENTPTSVPIDVAIIVVSDVDGGANTLSLSGADASVFQIVSDRLQLKPGVSLDAQSSAQLDVTVNVDDAGFGSGIEDSANYSLVISNSDEAPQVSAMDTAALVYVENNVPISISSNIEVSEPDNGMIVSAQVSIGIGFIAGEDWLAFTDQNGISGSYDDASGLLSLTGTATATQYQDAIRSVTYANFSDNPTTTVREIQVLVSDGVNLSDQIQRNITVVAVNDEEQLLQNSGGTVQQNDTLVLTTSMLNANDAEQSAGQLEYSPLGTWPSVQLIVGGNAVSSFTQADVDLGLVMLNFTGAVPGMNMLPLTVDDGFGSVSVFDMPINVIEMPEPEPEPEVGAAIPDAIEFLPEAVLSAVPALELESLVSFEALEQMSFATTSLLPEDGENAFIAQTVAEADESVEDTDAMGEASLSSLRIPEFTGYSNRLDALNVASVLSEPSTLIHKNIKVSDAERANLQIASLLSLDPLSIEGLGVFQAIDSNVGLMASIDKMQKQLAHAAEKLEGTASARDAVIGFSLSVTAGFLIWVLRGGALLASLFSISPLWKQLDPLPILNTAGENDSKKSLDDNVESLFDKAEKPSS